MKLAKWHGLSNDYLVVEELALPVPLTSEAVARLCDRHRGVGSDGILLRCPPTGAVPGAVTRMRIFNPDGSESEMCGNGIRIFARYLESGGAVAAGSEFVVETLAGPITPRLLAEGIVRVDMGWARFSGANVDAAALGRQPGEPVVDALLTAGGNLYRFTFVDVGNPHCVIVVDDPALVDLPTVGAAIEKHPLFPDRVNVEFIRLEPDGSVRMRVWERGVGETQACGTGATAVGAAAVRLGLATSPVTVRLLGGDLVIEVEPGEGGALPAGPAEPATAGTEAAAATAANSAATANAPAAANLGGDGGFRVFKTGPAEEVFTCELSDELLRRLGWPASPVD